VSTTSLSQKTSQRRLPRDCTKFRNSQKRSSVTRYNNATLSPECSCRWAQAFTPRNLISEKTRAWGRRSLNPGSAAVTTLQFHNIFLSRNRNTKERPFKFTQDLYRLSFRVQFEYNIDIGDNDLFRKESVHCLGCCRVNTCGVNQPLRNQ
jgi:hypothetical protein